MVECLRIMAAHGENAVKTANIILTGFMGTGKTAVGKMLAGKLHRPFVDMDALIEEQAGKSITRIFSEHGEPHFRAIETELVEKLSQQKEQIIATGGGIVLNPENIRNFSRSGFVVCLKTSPDEILRRVSGSSHRPLLEQEDRSARVRDLLKKRKPYYDAIQSQIDTTGLSVDEVANRIIVLFQKYAD